MVLDGMETMLKEKFPKTRNKNMKMNMVRYADDFIITSNSKEWLEQVVKPAVVEFLAARGLTLSPEKTKITHIKEGFDFLGWNIRKYNGKLLMKPSKANVQAHLGKIREIIQGNKTAKQVNLIRLLNPVLQGWANYHSHVVAKETFGKIDRMVWFMLWRWAAKRHPKKGWRWVKRKYYRLIATRQRQLFAATEKQKDGTDKKLVLIQESDTPIRRHVKIKANANPHDPEWEPYFETRWCQKMRNSSRGMAKFYRVWQRQDGICPVCQEQITFGSPWAVSHIVKVGDGGSDAMSNLEIKHLKCNGNHQYAENSGETGY